MRSGNLYEGACALDFPAASFMVERGGGFAFHACPTSGCVDVLVLMTAVPGVVPLSLARGMCPLATEDATWSHQCFDCEEDAVPGTYFSSFHFSGEARVLKLNIVKLCWHIAGLICSGFALESLKEAVLLLTPASSKHLKNVHVSLDYP